MYFKKLIKIIYSLACNNLPLKELYPKVMKFLSSEINEPVIKQYLDMLLMTILSLPFNNSFS